MKSQRTYINGGNSLSFLQYLTVAVFLVSLTLTACPNGGSGELITGGGGPRFDPKTPYPITVEAKLAQFVTEGTNGSGGTTQFLQVADFPADFGSPIPVPTSSVTSAKKGASVTVTIPALAEHRVSGGLTNIIAESGERAALNSSNQFTMPSGPTTVTIVYINSSDILRVPNYYGNELYSLDIPNGEVDATIPGGAPLPNPIESPFPGGDNLSYYIARIPFSGYPDVDITPLPLNVYAPASWSFADAAWADTADNSLQTDSGDDVTKFFRINVYVTPQVKVDYPAKSDIPDELKIQPVPGTGKTVEQMYDAAVGNVYHFRVIVKTPTIDARLFAINISGVSAIYKTANKSTEIVAADLGVDENDRTSVTFYAFPSFGTTEVSVVAETFDPGSKVSIDNGTYSSGSAHAEVSYLSGQTTTTFIVKVQAEDVTKTKEYTINLENSVSEYTAEAEGGTVYYEQDGTTITEIHSFYITSKENIETGAQKSFELKFDSATKPTTVEILVVGGGGAGGNFVPGRVDGKTGGGGAGGVIYSKSYTLGSSNDYIVKVGNGGGLGLNKGVNETFTLSGRELTIAAAQKGGDSFFGISDTDANRLVAPGGGGGANNNDGIKFYGGKGGSSGGSTEGNSRGDDAGSGSMPALYTPLLDFYYGGSAQQPDGTVKDDFTPDAGMAWGHTGVVRTHRDGDLKHCSWTGGGAGSVPATLSRTGGYGQWGRDWGRGIKIDITGTEREYARSHLSGQSTPTAGAPQTGNGGGGGGGVNGAAGGSGIVVVKWVRQAATTTP